MKKDMVVSFAALVKSGMTGNWIAGSVRVARTEWTCHHREFGGSRRRRIGLVILLCAIDIGLGSVSWSVGRLVAGGGSEPLERATLAATITFVGIAVRSSSLTHARFERLAPDALLTAVPARAVTLGLLSSVFARVSAVLAVPTVGVAVCLALGVSRLAFRVAVDRYRDYRLE